MLGPATGQVGKRAHARLTESGVTLQFVDKLPRHAKIPKLTWTGSSMVEQLTLNQRVAGSSPARFTTSLN
jgi:hypothetical protein